jgi:Fe-S cluster assembly protein SufD
MNLAVPSGISNETFSAELPASGSLVVAAAKNAVARVVIRVPRRSAGKTTVEIRAAEGAKLEIVSLCRSQRGSVEETDWNFYLEANASVNHTEIIVGSGVVKTLARVSLSAGGASACLNGLSVLADEASMKNETIVTHDAPDTVSRQRFKDILSGSARSEYSGLVHVKREAPRSDSNQICRNLLLSRNARAVSRPQLKIDTDDVKCSHGSATGELSENELFYLRSRGLSRESARAMLIEGFAEEIVLLLPQGDEALRAEAHKLVRNELERLAALLPEEAA